MFYIKVFFFFTLIVPISAIMVRYAYTISTSTLSTFTMLGLITTLNVVAFRLLPQSTREYVIEELMEQVERNIDERSSK